MTDRLVIYATGDISLGDDAFCMGYGVKATLAKHKKQRLFQQVSEVFKNGDVVFGNLEVVLSERGLQSDSLESSEMRSFPDAVNYLVDAHFNVLNVANNHSLQHGEEAFNETVSLLRDNGITPIGLKGSTTYTSQPEILEMKGIKIGFLGFAFEEDVYFKPPPLYAYYESRENILSNIQLLKNNVDKIVVSLHWGLEFLDRPSIANIRLARDIIDAGADIVLGHHPHVIQGIERYKHGLICYSLGNFVFDMFWNERYRRTMIVEICLNTKSNDIEWNVIPVWINDMYQPEIVAGNKKSEMLFEVNALSEKISKEMIGDPEKKAINYYLEYERLRKRDRIDYHNYLLRNINKLDKSTIIQIIKRTFKKAMNYVIS